MNKDEINADQSRKINRALGIFLLFFGIIILAAIGFTDTFLGKITNLVAGLLICLIGTLLVWQSLKKRKHD